MMTNEVKWNMTEDHSTDHLRRTVPENAAPDQRAGLENNAMLIQGPTAPRPARRWSEIWEGLLRLGLGEAAVRAGTILASLTMILLVMWVMDNFYLKGDVNYQRDAAIAAPLPTVTPTLPPPAFDISAAASLQNGIVRGGIARRAVIDTVLPTRARFEVTEYEVQKGDTVIGIAEKFGLQPQTILWGNFNVLADDPHRLQVGQKLNILPMDGVLLEWRAGEGLNGVAKAYGVTPDDIINWPENNLTREALGDYANPNIAVGTMLFVPGGQRPFISWSAPLISRSDPASAKIFGSGYCGVISDGYIGSGSFVWPTSERWISGYDYSPGTNHWGIDIAGDLGNPIFAVDSGVIVYAGWNDWGYGNVLVVDHGNGWQSLYAHLDQLFVTCGASVSQGVQIATMGSTGRSSGPHLHFELMDAGGNRINPWNFLQ